MLAWCLNGSLQCNRTSEVFRRLASMTSVASVEQPRCILIFEAPKRLDRDRSAEASTSNLDDAQKLHTLAARGCSTSVAYRDACSGMRYTRSRCRHAVCLLRSITHQDLVLCRARSQSFVSDFRHSTGVHALTLFAVIFCVLSCVACTAAAQQHRQIRCTVSPASKVRHAPQWQLVVLGNQALPSNL